MISIPNEEALFIPGQFISGPVIRGMVRQKLPPCFTTEEERIVAMAEASFEQLVQENAITTIGELRTQLQGIVTDAIVNLDPAMRIPFDQLRAA